MQNRILQVTIKRFLKRNLADVGPELANTMLQPQTRYMASSMTEGKIWYKQTAVNMLLIIKCNMHASRIIIA